MANSHTLNSNNSQGHGGGQQNPGKGHGGLTAQWPELVSLSWEQSPWPRGAEEPGGRASPDVPSGCSTPWPGVSGFLCLQAEFCLDFFSRELFLVSMQQLQAHVLSIK